MPAILAMELEFYPTGVDARADGHNVLADLVNVRVTRHRSDDPEMERLYLSERTLEIKRRLFVSKLDPGVFAATKAVGPGFAV